MDVRDTNLEYLTPSVVKHIWFISCRSVFKRKLDFWDQKMRTYFENLVSRKMLPRFKEARSI